MVSDLLMKASDRSALQEPIAHVTADAASPWPFRPVYLWDTPSRSAPLLVLFALLAVVTRPEPSTFHHTFDVAIPLLAIFWLMWPLLGPTRALTLAPWRLLGQLALAKRWMPSTNAPTPITMMMRAITALAALANWAWSGQLTDAHILVERLALALTTLQLLITWRSLSRAGHAPMKALLTGTGRGYSHETLRETHIAVALLLWTIPAFCWMWLDLSSG